jgi:archaellum biogenesis ATPase FlaH
MSQEEGSKTIYNHTPGGYDNIPTELKQMPNWVLWKYEEVNGRMTKVPYQTSHKKAKSNDPSTWTTFEEAISAASDFSGIGFCVPLDGSLYMWGFDFDDAIDPETKEFKEFRLPTGELAPIQPRDVFDLGSYTEGTPSGAGLRTITTSKVPVPGGNKKEYGERNPKTGKTPGIEMYSSGRFFTFTGNRLEGTPATVAERTTEALAFHARVFGEQRATVEPKNSIPPGKNIARIEKLAMDLIEGRIPESSRYELMFGMTGVLIRLGWSQEDIDTLLSYLIQSFNDDDHDYDVSATLHKHREILARLFSSEDRSKLPSVKYLTEHKLLTPETIEIVRSLDKPGVQKADAAGVLTLIRMQPPESFERTPIKYLIDPLIPAGSLVMITGQPGSGKSTLVLQWCIEMAEAGNEVMYLDRDNPMFIAQQRIERFGGTTPANLAYWGLWSRDENGEPMEPPPPDSDLYRDMILNMKNPVLVFDTFASFASGDENDNAVVGAIFKRLRYLTNLGATILIIHHTAKDSKSEYRGASAMKGAVDAALLIEGSIVEGKLTRIEVKTYKTRLGDGKPVVYGVNAEGIPTRETETVQDAIRSLLVRNPGLSKDKFEKIAVGAGFRRNTVRDFLDHGIVGGTISYEEKKLILGPKAVAVEVAA